jgi:acyl-CoA reductase-like NAD-dependent aldehyde dehydrogenase
MRAPTTSSDRYADLVDDLVASGSDSVSVPSPTTGERLHELPRSTADDVRSAVSRARLAQLAWARAGFAHRRRVLLAAHDLVLERREELLDLVQLESGKTRGQAFEEVFQAAAVTRYNALSAKRVLGGHRRRTVVPFVTTTRVRYRPKGVTGVITPWNYALSLAAMDVVPALAAGCAVVQKADDQGVLSILALRRAYIDAGVPESLWAVVAGTPDEVGETLTDEVDFICFTGSTATGRRIGEKAGRRLIGASLELGGKNALLVLDDVRPEQAAADAAYACFSAMGQLCVSIERIYVQRAVADSFTAAFVQRLERARVSTALDYSADFGSLATAAQLARVEAEIADAVSKGATVLTGGHRVPDAGPWAYAPTVLTDVTPDMRVFAEETFGAVATLTVVDTETEGILAANASEYGLNAAVLTGSLRRGQRVADALDAGSVNINEGYRGTFSSVDAPMGGAKQSGVGRRNGPEGLLRFVEPVTVAAATGLMQLPRTGTEFRQIVGLFLLFARTLKFLRRA